MAGNGKHLPAEERRAVIVETVLELAAEGNPAEITTAAIAERMRLTQGALFRHFQSKDAVWSAVMEWVAERLLLLVSRAMKGASTPLAPWRPPSLRMFASPRSIRERRGCSSASCSAQARAFPAISPGR